MSTQVTFASAAAYTLDALGDIFTRSFENYFYPGTTTAAVLAARVRTEQIDLQRSLVMRLGDEPAGIALLGLRGDRLLLTADCLLKCFATPRAMRL